jgi:sigma-B regulation protein RsbU (phosphoserine phosphatase)
MWRGLALLCFTVLAAATQTIDATSGPWSATLDGTWRWHPGDDMRWAPAAFDDSEWTKLALPSPPPSAPQYWVRIPVLLGTLSDPGLLLGPIAYAYEIYWDGQRIGQFGELPPSLKWFEPRWQTFHVPANLAKPGDHTIALRIWNEGWPQRRYPFFSSSDNRIGDFNVLNGTETSLKAIEFRRDIFQFLTEIIFVVAGLYFLLLPPSISQGTAFRWFGAYLLGAGLYRTSVFYAEYGPLTAPANVVLGTGVVAGFLSLASGIEFPCALFRRRVPVAVRCFQVLLILAAAYMLQPSLVTPMVSVWRFLFWNSFLIAYLIPLFIAGLEFHKGIPGSGVAVVLFALVALTGIGSPLRGYYGMTVPADLSVYAGGFRMHLYELPLLLWIPAMAMQIHESNMRFRDEQQRLRGEMEAARHVQEILIPPQSIKVPGFDIDASYRPATEVGGDFFQLFPASKGSLLLVVGDVSGKG